MSDIIRKKLMARVSVDELTGCWNWTAYCDKRGLPSFAPSKGKRVSAARASFINFMGDIFDDSLVVLQTCGNKRCINPDHLSLENGGRFRNKLTCEKTHCVHGHTLEDAYILKNGHRRCRTCDRLRCKNNAK